MDSLRTSPDLKRHEQLTQNDVYEISWGFRETPKLHDGSNLQDKVAWPPVIRQCALKDNRDVLKPLYLKKKKKSQLWEYRLKSESVVLCMGELSHRKLVMSLIFMPLPPSPSKHLNCKKCHTQRFIKNWRSQRSHRVSGFQESSLSGINDLKGASHHNISCPAPQDPGSMAQPQPPTNVQAQFYSWLLLPPGQVHRQLKCLEMSIVPGLNQMSCPYLPLTVAHSNSHSP